METTQSAEHFAREAELLRNLKSWATFHNFVTTINSEEELYWLIQAERNGSGRIRVINRIYSRLNVIRKERELRELAEGQWPFGGVDVNGLRLRD